MMKKTYINPTMKVVNIKTNTQLLAGSPGLSGEYGGGTILSREFEDFDVFGAFNDMNDLQDLFKE